MDLTLLQHLSDEALAEEAERRGISIADKCRDELIASIRAHETRAKRDSEEPVDPGRVTLPPDDGGAFGAARAFFGKVAKIAKKTIEKRETAPSPPLTKKREQEPIPTRSMANVLIEQGELDRARVILLDLVNESEKDEREDVELALALDDVTTQLNKRELERDATRAIGELTGPFIALLSQGDLRAVAYRLDEPKLERGRALLGAAGVATLRSVTIVPRADHAVSTEQNDFSLGDREGWRYIETAAAARLVVSVGLKDGDRFVSVLHASFQP